MKRVSRLLLLSLAALAGQSADAKVLVRAAGNTVDVEFQYRDPRAGSVVVSGSFNQWSLSAAPMTQGPDGVWSYVLHGAKPSDVLQYKFVVGTSQQWVLDPDAPDTAADGKGGMNGQIVVSRFVDALRSDDVPLDLSASGEPIPQAPTLPPSLAEKVNDGSRNLLGIPGFESDALEGWTVHGDAGAVSIEHEPANVHGGAHALKLYSANPYGVLLMKRLTGLTPGIYSFRAWAMGGGGEPALKIFARDCGGPDMAIPIVNAGWQKWKQYVVKSIQVKKPECTIGVYARAGAGNWSDFDDMEFMSDATWSRLTVEPAR